MPQSQLTAPQLEAVKLLATGATVSAAAKAAGVHRSSVYNWCRDHAEFRAALRHSKIQAAEVIDDEVRELASLAVDTIRQLLASDKTPAATKLKAAQYVLEAAAKPGIDVIRDKIEEVHELAGEFRKAAEPAARPTPIRQDSTPRNALCPCRSGEKFKRCCGKSAPPMLYPNAA